MKYILYILFSAILTAVSYGYYIKTDNEQLGHRLIGLSVIGFFLIWMPLFIFHRYKNKDLKKYMITDKTIQKIKDEAETFID